ncbi:hypothetical protein GCM10009557_92350 [Virgisporangium ochraceum]|uniref:Uncharacterized protein n=1 Tax=Virgisporangium ochraceum TaxID=65505 RepID=A0A8J4EG28_9ACTN|nr:hypothetical protein Voc01_082480 [Virgisporangium ochraceum]
MGVAVLLVRLPVGAGRTDGVDAKPDGADGLFQVLLDGSPVAYQRFAEDYAEDLAQIGYPSRPV